MRLMSGVISNRLKERAASLFYISFVRYQVAQLWVGEKRIAAVSLLINCFLNLGLHALIFYFKCQPLNQSKLL